MKMTRITLGLALISLFFATCKPAQTSTGGDDGLIEFTILQMNDVYEISPLGDNKGGLARVAQLRKELLAKNPNTYTVLSGDFISPSVIGTLKYENKRIRGRQMVDVMNTLGVDWVVFGNHEFDYDDLADLQARLDESTFQWLAANARLKTDAGLMPFFKNRNGAKENCPDNLVVDIKDADGTSVKLGLFGVLLDSGKKPWVQYSDWADAARKNFEELKAKTDIVLAITHLPVEDDKKLAAMLPEVPLVMGGHDHENMFHRVGRSVVTKADANARTVYVHAIRYDKKQKRTVVKSELRQIDSKITDEPATAAVVAKWEKIKNDALGSSGFDPSRKVMDLKEPLDCREISIRNKQMPVGKMITDAMLAAAKNKPDCALLNSGSIRVDDVLNGALNELDIVRMLPFGGAIVEVEMKGSMLRKTLDTGWSNKMSGGYLQWGNISREESAAVWLINKKPLEDGKTYRVILPEFLLSGNETNMAFLKTAATADGKGTTNPDIPVLHKANASDKSDVRNDIRLAFIRYYSKN